MLLDFELSDAQYGHAVAIEHLVPSLSYLRTELCSSNMSEACFWKIYFVLLHSKLSKQDAEILSTPQVYSLTFALVFFLSNCVFLIFYHVCLSLFMPTAIIQTEASAYRLDWEDNLHWSCHKSNYLFMCYGLWSFKCEMWNMLCGNHFLNPLLAYILFNWLSLYSFSEVWTGPFSIVTCVVWAQVD